MARQLGAAYRVIDEGWSRTDVDYFDRKLIVVFDDGLLAEVQLWEPGFYKAKGEGHKLYKQRRELVEALGDAHPDVLAIIEREKEFWARQADKLGPEWREIYSAAIGSAPGASPNAARSSANISRAAASDIGRPSRETSAELTGSQPRLADSTKAPPEPATASRLSQSYQRTDKEGIRTSEQNVGGSGGAGKVLGDPALAREADRILAEAGGDLNLVIVDRAADGTETVRRVSAREAEEDAAALKCRASLKHTGLRRGDAVRLPAFSRRISRTLALLRSWRLLTYRDVLSSPMSRSRTLLGTGNP